MAQKEPAVRLRIASRRPGYDRPRFTAQIIVAKPLDQHRDRIAARDEMVVGEAEVKRGSRVDGEKTERQERAFGGKRRVEVALDLALGDGQRAFRARPDRPLPPLPPPPAT